MIQILEPERWPELAEIFAREFHSSLPHAGRSQILADVDEDGKINGFVVTEILLRVGLIHTPGRKLSSMLHHIEANMLPDSGVIAIAHSDKFEKFCKDFKMREIPGVVYRRDF